MLRREMAKRYATETRSYKAELFRSSRWLTEPCSNKLANCAIIEPSRQKFLRVYLLESPLLAIFHPLGGGQPV